ncbi:fluoride efflux transporter FluC [Citricoccus sp. GCM10030269]|uniref:fluoride efflux transporter FluC n=1 Tax=Citricoccus sp. GCM10030269 TaxID=3273388 RepID=UPI003613EE33
MGAGLMVGIALAGAIGAVLRLLADHYLYPRGILVANVVGSFIAGLATSWAEGPLELVWVAGLAGALTTFSTVSVSTARDVLSGRFRAAALTWAVHVTCGLAAVVLGLAAGGALTVLG